MNNSFRITLDPEKLALAMANKSFTVSKLAEVTGRSRAIVTTWINARTVNPKQAGELAKALEVDVKDLI